MEVRPQLAMFAVGNAQLTVHVTDDYNTTAGVAGPVALWVWTMWIASSLLASNAGVWRTADQKTIFSGERLAQVLDPFGNLIGFRQAAA